MDGVDRADQQLWNYLDLDSAPGILITRITREDAQRWGTHISLSTALSGVQAGLLLGPLPR